MLEEELDPATLELLGVIGAIVIDELVLAIEEEVVVVKTYPGKESVRIAATRVTSYVVPVKS